MTEQQLLQEEEYNYPYHYIGKYLGGFSNYIADDWAINYISTISFLLDKIKKLRPKVVVDMGCGDGRFTGELQRTLKDSKVIGIDYSHKSIGLARIMNPKCVFIDKNILTENIAIKSDMVILMEVIEHIPISELDSFIDRVHGLLKPSGRLIVTVPHKNKDLEVKHFQHFDSKTIYAHFGKHFSIKEMIYIERKGIILRLISAILNNQYFLIRHSHFLQLIYLIWQKMVFIAQDENNCQRMIIILKKK